MVGLDELINEAGTREPVDLADVAARTDEGSDAVGE